MWKCYTVYYRIDAFCIFFAKKVGTSVVFVHIKPELRPWTVNSLGALCMERIESDVYSFRIEWLFLKITVKCNNWQTHQCFYVVVTKHPIIAVEGSDFFFFFEEHQASFRIRSVIFYKWYMRGRWCWGVAIYVNIDPHCSHWRK